MKKLLLTYIAFFSAAALNQLCAQISKGSIPLAGNFSVWNHSTDGKDSINVSHQNDFSFSVTPSIGYFKNNNLSLGLGLGYYYGKLFSDQTTKFPSGTINNKTTETRQDLSIAPYITYYIRLSTKAYCSIKSTVEYSLPLAYNRKVIYNYSTPITTELIRNVKSYSISARVSPNFIYFLYEKFAITSGFDFLSFSYNYSTIKNVSHPNYGKSSTYGLNLAFSSFNIGVQYFFIKKQIQ